MKIFDPVFLLILWIALRIKKFFKKEYVPLIATITLPICYRDETHPINSPYSLFELTDWILEDVRQLTYQKLESNPELKKQTEMAGMIIVKFERSFRANKISIHMPNGSQVFNNPVPTEILSRVSLERMFHYFDGTLYDVTTETAAHRRDVTLSGILNEDEHK